MFKSPSIKHTILNLGGWAAFLAVSVVTWQFVDSVVNSDALSAYRQRPSELSDRDGVIVKDFQLKSYVGDRLATEVLVDEATIWTDRSTIELVGLRDGKFYGEDKKEYMFTAGRAEYGTYAKSILAKDGVRIWNKSMDLKSAGFLYDHVGKQVQVNGDVTGKLDEGDLISKNVVLYLDPDSISTGELSWKGMLELQSGQKTPWQVNAEKSTIKNGIYTYIKARGQDKDTLVISDKMVWDREKDIVTAEGNVQYFGVDANMSCDKAVIERKIGKATLTGKVVNMLVKPEDSAPKQTGIPPVVPLVPDSIASSRPQQGGGNQDDPVRSSDNIRQYPIAMRAEKIEYWYRKGERRAILTGDPFARQELGALQWREVSANKAEYDGEAEYLVLRSAGTQRVRLKNSTGDDLTATYMKVSTQKGNDEMEAEGLTGTVMIDENELPERPGGGSGGGGTTGSTGSTGGGLSGPIRGGR